MGSEGPGVKGGSRKQLGRRGQRASEEMGVWVWKAGKDRCVQTEKKTDTGGQLSGSSRGGRAGVTFSTAGLVEDVFLENHLLLHGGKCVVVIL